jgi:hypothetical protein
MQLQKLTIFDSECEQEKLDYRMREDDRRIESRSNDSRSIPCLCRFFTIVGSDQVARLLGSGLSSRDSTHLGHLFIHHIRPLLRSHRGAPSAAIPSHRRTFQGNRATRHGGPTLIPSTPGQHESGHSRQTDVTSDEPRTPETQPG